MNSDFCNTHPVLSVFILLLLTYQTNVFFAMFVFSIDCTEVKNVVRTVLCIYLFFSSTHSLFLYLWKNDGNSHALLDGCKGGVCEGQ